MSNYKVNNPNNPIDYILVGGGGHCHSCINSIVKSGHNVIGIIDGYIEGDILGFPVIGCDDDIPQLMIEHPNAEFIVTVGMIKGTSALRQKLYENLVINNAVKNSTVSSCAAVSPFAKIGVGSIVLEGAAINANAFIGENVIVNTGAIIEHDAYVGSHSHVSTGAIVNGGVKVGENCMIGSGAIILQAIEIVANTTIAAGSVVTKNITIAGTWVGIPAIRKDK
tara:strand:+ start:5736 stop:6404 length:669 start_codon:yes stop_codon:yes gene_type:complete